MRMDENEDAELFALAPERMEPGIGKFVACAARAHCRAPQAEFLHGMFELFGGELRNWSATEANATMRSGYVAQ